MEKLLKHFLKGDPSSSEVRQKYGLFSGIFGVVCNLILSTIKIIVGLMTGMVSISADAVNNLSDMFSSIVTIAGFKLSGKPADKEHPYGHGRLEYISGFIVSIFVIVIAVELFKTSVEHIIKKSKMDVDIVTIIILVCAILLKFFMAYTYLSVSRIISSRALKASAMDSISDCVTTGVALLSVMIKLFLDLNIDGYAGAIVSLIVIYTGLKSSLDTINMLLGEAPGKEVVDRIKELALEPDDIFGIHDLRVHDYGPARSFASLHVEIDYRLGIIKAHEIIDEIENRIVEEGLVSEVIIHMDPVVVDDDNMQKLKRSVSDYIEKTGCGADLHDFHIIRCKGYNKLMFDVQFPYEYQCDFEKFKNDLINNLHLANEYKVFINIEKGDI